jgi:hypothetical protein
MLGFYHVLRQSNSTSAPESCVVKYNVRLASQIACGREPQVIVIASDVGA